MEVPGRRFELRGCDDASNTCPSIYCEPCEENDRQQAASAYCSDCNEFICTACERTHRGSKISRQHKILDQSTMPKQKLLSREGTFCPRHGGKVLDYYCQDDGEVACGVCVNLDHRKCSNIDFIRDAASRYENSEEYKNLMSKIQELTITLKGNITTADENRKKIVAQNEILLSDIKRFKKELDSILDALEETITKEVGHLEDENHINNEAVKDSCQSMESEINRMSTDMENGRKYNQGQQFMIAAKNAEKQVGKLENEVFKLTNDHPIVFKTFKPDDKLLILLKSVTAIGRLEISSDLRSETDKTDPGQSEMSASNHDSPHNHARGAENKKSATTCKMSKDDNKTKKEPTKLRAKFISEIYVKLKQEKCNVYITSGIDMGDGSLVLVDNGNSCMKMVDTIRREVRLLTKLPFKPWDIAVYRGSQYVVSSENKLVFLNIEETVSMDREIQVDGDCRGIAVDDTNIIIACAAPNPSVKIINAEGQELRVIKHDSIGQSLFLNPWYLRITHDRKSILVSDFEKHRVTSLTTEGHVMCHYGDKNLKGPTGMAVDSEGFVFLAGRKSHNLHLMSMDCKPIQILLQRRAGEELPQAVIWCKSVDKLFVSHNWRTRMCNTLSVYNVQ